jgi:hypothetical protein
MRKIVLSILFTIIIFLGKGNVQAQLYLPEANPCDVSAEEILSVIKSVYNLSPISEEVLIAGEIRTGYLRVPKEPLSVIQAFAMVGYSLKTASFRFYLIRQTEGKANKLEIDLRDIKKGRAKDVILEKGDVIFVPRGYVDGKLLQPSEPVYLRVPRGTDYPIKVPDNRISK